MIPYVEMALDISANISADMTLSKMYPQISDVSHMCRCQKSISVAPYPTKLRSHKSRRELPIVNLERSHKYGETLDRAAQDIDKIVQEINQLIVC